MDCRTCEPTLIDLVHDELATDAAREARAHLAECASCRASFERLVSAQKLAAQLEVVPAPQQVSARLLQLADARASELRAAAVPQTQKPTFGRAILDFIARFATGPQVGMLTIMLLIAAVGLYSLPRMRKEQSVAPGTLVDADGEAVASPGVEPADRLDLKVDPRSRRIRSSGDATAPAAPAAVAVTPSGGLKQEGALASPAQSDGKKLAEDPLARLDDFDDVLGVGAKAGGTDTVAADAPAEKRDEAQNAVAEQPARERGQTQSSGLGSLATSASGQRHSAPEGVSVGPEPFPASKSAAPARAEPSPAPRADLLLQPYRENGQAQSESTRRARQSSRPQAQAQTAPGRAAPALDDLLDADMARSGGGAAPAAASEPKRKSQAQETSPSLLADARAVSRAQGCAAALPSYERVVKAAPGSRDAGTALIEMAQCKRTLGQTAEAQRLLERAVDIPATAQRARALLTPVASKPSPTASPASSD